MSGGALAISGLLSACGGGGGEAEESPEAQLARWKKRPEPAPAPAPAPEPAPAPVSGVAGRPFRAESIWNIPIPGGAPRNSWISPWSAGVGYARGDCVRASNGSETYLYVSLTGGAGRALPSGQSSNADWAFVGCSMSQWYDQNAGTPVFRAASTDPVWTLRFHPDCYGNLYGGAWSRRITDGAKSDGIWNASSSTFLTDYNGYVTVSTWGLVAPTWGTYDPKGRGQTDSLLLPTKALRAPAGILPSQGGTDWTMIVHLDDGTVLETFATVLLTGNRIVCGSYKITRPSLSGDGWQNGFRASMVPGYAGLVTQSEWASAWAEDVSTGGAKGTIPHALAILAPARLLKQACVYPATAWDSQQNGAYTGTRLPMGQRVALPADFALNTADFTHGSGRFARIIGRTLKAYGGMVVDRGGAGLSILHEATGDTGSASQVLRYGGGAEPSGSYYNDQMLRKMMANTELVSVPVGSYIASA